MKRNNIEMMISWLDALRRRDVEAVSETLDPEIVWHGLREDLVCHGREEVAETFVGQRDEGYEIDSIEIIGAANHVVLGLRLPDAHNRPHPNGERWRGAPVISQLCGVA